MFPDIHTHLPDQITASLRVLTGTSPADWEEIAALAERSPGEIVPAFGLHPWYLRSVPPDWYELLTDFLRRFPNALVGETGLDKARRPYIPPEYQKEIFLRQCHLAQDLDRPVILHCVRAWGMLLDILKNERLPAPGFLCHGFDAPAEHLPVLLKSGAWFSLGPRQLTSRHRETLAKLPLHRILMESDGTDKDTYLRSCSDWAGIFQLPPDSFAAIIRQNTLRFLKRPNVPPEP